MNGGTEIVPSVNKTNLKMDISSSRQTGPSEFNVVGLCKLFASGKCK